MKERLNMKPNQKEREKRRKGIQKQKKIQEHKQGKNKKDRRHTTGGTKKGRKNYHKPMNNQQYRKCQMCKNEGEPYEENKLQM